MTLRELREQLRQGRSLYELPLRVTFYARVSTDKEEQRNSLENQVQYYTDFIRQNSSWTYVPGYVDEGISGTSTWKREQFLQMIRDACRGRFDFIITKEISRFSRSTLDSIRYTQELLEHGVGVLFQNDNINTLDTDSEFRLVVMAGVAQDEVRKLSERLKFGFRQSIKNGHVLGNDRLWGYDKQNCRLTVNQEQAPVVRLIFELYATGNYGVRSLSRELTARGFSSLEGTPFNQTTIRHILTNPKYKGWYCGNKTRSLDYRTKKQALLPREEWVLYRDPEIPAIVSEELWDRANAIFRARSARSKAHGQGGGLKYPYSGKIFCGLHGDCFHRQCLRTQGGFNEYWRCKRYRDQGKAGCPLPALRSRELDAILAALFPRLIPHPEQLQAQVLQCIREAQRQPEAQGLDRLQAQLHQLEQKKDALLELYGAGAITCREFQQRNDKFNRQIMQLEAHFSARASDLARETPGQTDTARLEEALKRALNFEGDGASYLAAALLDRAVVLEGSHQRELNVVLYLKSGQVVPVHLSRSPFHFSFPPAVPAGSETSHDDKLPRSPGEEPSEPPQQSETEHNSGASAGT